MKSIILILIYLTTFMGLFLFMSLIGLIFTADSYTAIIHNEDWIIMYSIFIGWWVSLFPAFDYYEKYIEN